MFERYKWQVDRISSQIGGLEWHRIDCKRLDGLLPAVVLGEIHFESQPPSGRYLRREGGMVGRYYQAYILNNGFKTRLETVEEVRRALCPIKSQAQAMTLVGLVVSDLLTIDDRLVGTTTELDERYLVHVIYRNSFGCSQHRPVGELFEVTKSGQVLLVGQEILFPDPSIPEECAD